MNSLNLELTDQEIHVLTVMVDGPMRDTQGDGETFDDEHDDALVTLNDKIEAAIRLAVSQKGGA